MSDLIPCSTCKTTLVKHCESHTCHWLRCRNSACEWGIYDVELGSRASVSGVVERLGTASDG
jgi:hypothetical protein